MLWEPYEPIWAHISCYSCRFMYYILTFIYPVSFLVEIKLFQIFQIVSYILLSHTLSKWVIIANEILLRTNISHLRVWSNWKWIDRLPLVCRVHDTDILLLCVSVAEHQHPDQRRRPPVYNNQSPKAINWLPGNMTYVQVQHIREIFNVYWQLVKFVFFSKN